VVMASKVLGVSSVLPRPSSSSTTAPASCPKEVVTAEAATVPAITPAPRMNSRRLRKSLSGVTSSDGIARMRLRFIVTSSASTGCAPITGAAPVADSSAPFPDRVSWTLLPRCVQRCHTVDDDGEHNDGQTGLEPQADVTALQAAQNLLAEATRTYHRRQHDHRQRQHYRLVHPRHDGRQSQREADEPQRL